MFLWKIRWGVALMLIVAFWPSGVRAEFQEDLHFINPQFSRRISLDFKNAALSEVLKVFSKQSGMNFIVSDKIGAIKITLYLDNVPLEEALENILSANNLKYEMQKDRNIFVVKEKKGKSDDVIVMVFPLKHASVPSAKLRSTLDIKSSDAGSSGGPSIVPGGILMAVKAVLTPAGTIVEDPRTNSLIVRDVKSRFELIKKTIEDLDRDVPQVLIEVEMLDVSQKTIDLMGVKWGNTFFEFSGSSKVSILPFNQSDALSGGKTTLIPTSSSSSSSSSTASPYTAGSLNFSKMNAVVQFLKTQTDTKTLARPRLMTLNNETAQINISTNQTVGVKTKVSDSSSTTKTESEAERQDTGLFLTVTPQANMYDNTILMAVHPKVIEAADSGVPTGIAGANFKDPEERGSQTILKVKDGETVFIGGLVRTEKTNTVTKVPFLGDIPFVGGAFRHKSVDGRKRELVIFLTPHIIREYNADALIGRDAPEMKLRDDDEIMRRKSVNDQMRQFEL